MEINRTAQQEPLNALLQLGDTGEPRVLPPQNDRLENPPDAFDLLGFLCAASGFILTPIFWTVSFFAQFFNLLSESDDEDDVENSIERISRLDSDCNLSEKKKIIDSLPDINGKDEFDYSLIHYLCMNGDKGEAAARESIELVLYAVAKGADPNLKTGGEQQSPLFFTRNPLLVECLLNSGADVNSTDQSNNTPLHGSPIPPPFEVARLLIRKGAQVDAKDSQDTTPLHRLANHLRPTKKDLLTAALLLESGASIDARDQENDTALSIALGCKNYPLAKWLIENGADVNIKNNSGDTPLLLLALLADRTDLAQLLIQHGARIDETDSNNQTALELANSSQHPSIAQLLQNQE